MTDTDSIRDTPRQREAQLAEELERVGGVLAASVRLGDGSEVRDVYIAAAEGAAIGPIRDAALDVLRRAGLTARPTAFRIGAVAGPQPSVQDGEPTPWQGRFLLLDGLDIQRSQGRVSCRVTLVRLREEFQGEATELDTDLGRARAAARATLAAAEKASPAYLGLEGAQITQMFGRRYVAVSVEATAARRFVVLSGILALDGARSVEEASALATLGAVERFISW